MASLCLLVFLLLNGNVQRGSPVISLWLFEWEYMGEMQGEKQFRSYISRPKRVLPNFDEDTIEYFLDFESWAGTGQDLGLSTMGRWVCFLCRNKGAQGTQRSQDHC